MSPSPQTKSQDNATCPRLCFNCWNVKEEEEKATPCISNHQLYFILLAAVLIKDLNNFKKPLLNPLYYFPQALQFVTVYNVVAQQGKAPRKPVLHVIQYVKETSFSLFLLFC